MTEEEEQKIRKIPSPGFVSENHIFEQLSDGCYVIFDRGTKHCLELKPSSFPRSAIEYIPLPRLPWPTIDELQDYDTEEQLFKEIRSFLTDHLDLSNDLFFDVYSCFVLATWRSEDFTVLPYLFFLGPLASGKTRALECLCKLCYRSIMASSLSAAALFRALEAWHPTLLLDETEIYNREAMIEVLALLNSGYRRGQYAIRVTNAEEGCPELGFFDTFGFKVLAGTEELAATLQSRCIITTMSKAVRHVNLFVDEKRAQYLRNKLLTYRFKNVGVNKAFDVSKLEYFNNARVIEMFVALLQVAPTEEIQAHLIACMKQITKSRLDEEQASIEARVYDAIQKCEGKIENGKLSTQTITETFNDGLPEKEQATSRFVGRKVASLGFEKCRLSGGPSGFFWNEKLIERLKERYYPSPKTTSLTSQTSLSMEKETETKASTSEVCEESPSQARKPLIVNSTVKSEVSEESEVSEVSLEVTHKPTIQEIFQALRPKLHTCFSEEKLLHHIIELGFTREQAERLIIVLADQGIIAMDDVGNWCWVKGN